MLYNDRQLHIKPIAETDIETMLVDNISSRATRNIVIDEVAEYSVEELDEASLVLEDYMDEYHITYIALDNQNNGLAIGMTEITQETEEALRAMSPIDNISFDLLETEDVSEIQGAAEEEVDTRAAADKMARPGTTLYNNGVVEPTSETIYEKKKIVAAGDAVDRMAVTIINSNVKPVETKVAYAFATINWEDGYSSYKMRHMMVMDNGKTTGGDSGSPIVANYGSNYKLLGIHKGRMNDGISQLVGSNWGFIAGSFDLPSSLEIYR